MDQPDDIAQSLQFNSRNLLYWPTEATEFQSGGGYLHRIT